MSHDLYRLLKPGISDGQESIWSNYH